LLLGLLVQDPVQRQLDEALRRFEEAVRAQEAYEALSDQLAALGETALVPIARRLAEDLRDGMASAAAPVLLAALEGHPEALSPLREAFERPDTEPSGRMELALALSRLQDHRSWRQGLRALADDPSADPDDRVRASEILLLDDELAGVPSSRDLRAGLEEPRVTLVDEVERPAAPRSGLGEDGERKKDGTSDDSFITMRSVVAGAAAGLLALLLALKRKG
ncbi:MAG: hypothetical protein ACRD2T_00575, partial [Thermoanaerobaculia bacterium]